MSKSAPVIGIALFGGIGARFDETLPKQFFDCGGKPLLCYVLEAFEESSSVDSVLVVSHPDFIKKTEELIQQGGFRKISSVIGGGETRTLSVENALKHLEEQGIEEDSIVLIQDGDRPNLSQSLIEENIAAAKRYGAAITAVQSTDTCFESEDGSFMGKSVKRSKLYRAQTPQSFRFGLIKDAYGKRNEEDDFTDDASIALKAGVKAKIVLGEAGNVKITEKEDLNFFLSRRQR